MYITDLVHELELIYNVHGDLPIYVNNLDNFYLYVQYEEFQTFVGIQSGDLENDWWIL